jgi:hypothetical protein
MGIYLMAMVAHLFVVLNLVGSVNLVHLHRQTYVHNNATEMMHKIL